MNWSCFQPDVQTVDKSAPDKEIAKWNENVSISLPSLVLGKPATSVVGMKPGSTTYTNQRSSGSGRYRLLKQTSNARMHDYYFGFKYTLYWYWNLYVTY